eukprot:6178415-Pleurochrysis_carterae.AAC.1
MAATRPRASASLPTPTAPTTAAARSGPPASAPPEGERSTRPSLRCERWMWSSPNRGGLRKRPRAR